MFAKEGNELEPVKDFSKSKGAVFAVGCIGCDSGNCLLCLRKLLRSNRVENLTDHDLKIIHVTDPVKGKKLG